MNRVRDRACIVTGAGSGIGCATAQRLAEEGAARSVLCVDRNANTALETAHSIVAAGGTAHTDAKQK